MRIDPPRGDTELYWKVIWEKERHLITPMCSGWWTCKRTTGHLPEQDSITITKVADIQGRVSGMKSGTALDPDMIHSY